jgi:uncharacterized protein YecE (DUF72 family)
VDLRVGTSGFAYKSWKGSFYPADLPASRWLAYYAGRLPAVEINNTFYRMPRPAMLTGWAEQVPPGFRFALKASRRITHQKRLAEVADELSYLYAAAKALGEHRGPMLFQLPPFLKKDMARLQAFLTLLPEDHRATLEFRHPSWHDDEVFDALREHDVALCIADAGEVHDAPVVATAQLGYLRLRRSAYADEDLSTWVAALRSGGWQDAYVFFKHEEAGVGPALASRFQALYDARTPRRAEPARRTGTQEGAA